MALDPDLWNDDGTAKKPSPEYMKRLEEATPFLDFVEKVDGTASWTDTVRGLTDGRAPLVGDLVHFWDGEVCRAAIVMEAEDHVATLRVHIPHQPFEDWEADHQESRETGGSWHWSHA